MRTKPDDARDLVLTAMRELGEPARFDQILDHVLGSGRWGRLEEAPYARAIATLTARGDVIKTVDGWESRYRLATDTDRADAEDAVEVARLTASWEPA